MTGELVRVLHHHGSGGGVAHLFSFIAHAAIWSAVSRLMRHAPGGVAVVLFAVACVLVLVLHRRGRRR